MNNQQKSQSIAKRTAAFLAALMVIISVPIYLMPASAKVAPSGAKEYKGHTYYVYKNTVTWKKAKALCEAKGGHLATITSSGENNFVKSLVNTKDIGYCWLGATDEAKEGTWKWVTGEKFSYKDWYGSQPDNYDGVEDYLSTYYNTQWNDSPDNAHGKVTGYVCEWDMSKKSVDSVRFAQTSVSIYYGSTKTLTILNNTKKITWSTSNKAVATVSSKGVVTGKGLGSCTITAKIGSKSYKCKITVKDRNLSASSSIKTYGGGYFILGVSKATVTFKVPRYSCAKATVSIMSSSGSTVYERTYSNVKKNTSYSFNWSGKNEKGNYVSEGSYRVKVIIGTKNSYSSYLSVKAKGDFAGGNGSKTNPFLVSSTTQFRKIVKYPSAYFKQTCSLNFNYSSVGNFFTNDKPFNGVYDGGNYTISCVSSTAPLFNVVGTKGQIKNLKLSKCSVVAHDSALLVASNLGRIVNCNVSGTVSGTGQDSRQGIIAILNYGTITNCTASGTANSSNGGYGFIGGISSWNAQSGKIISCSSTAELNESQTDCRIGGIVGKNEGMVTDCEASGTIISTAYCCNDYTGGVVGLNDGQVIDCVYTGSSVVNIAGGGGGVVA